MGTRFRIATFAAGAVVGTLALVILPVMLSPVVLSLWNDGPAVLQPILAIWLALVGALWLGSVVVGSWFNVSDAGMTGPRRWVEIARTICLAPFAGTLESSAGLWAVLQWWRGKRTVAWLPTPKTKAADAVADWRNAA